MSGKIIDIDVKTVREITHSLYDRAMLAKRLGFDEDSARFVRMADSVVRYFCRRLTSQYGLYKSAHHLEQILADEQAEQPKDLIKEKHCASPYNFLRW